jgi:hypothetical protein
MDSSRSIQTDKNDKQTAKETLNDREDNGRIFFEKEQDN